MKKLKEWSVHMNRIKYEYVFPSKTIMLRNEEGKLHSDTQPAFQSPYRLIWYRNGKRHGLDVTKLGSLNYYYEGILVPNEYIEKPQDITTDQVLNEKNQEVRYVGIRIVGIENFVKKGIRVDKRKDKELFRFDLGFSEPVQFLKVLNSTPERDGTKKVYFLCVPPTVKTCQEAVAWTFYCEAGKYAPKVET